MGRATLGRIINVIGEAIDHRGDISKHFLLLSFFHIMYCFIFMYTPSHLRLINNPDALCNCLVILSVAETDHYLPIHREAPAFVEQATDQQILVTGIKVIFLGSYTTQHFILLLTLCFDMYQ